MNRCGSLDGAVDGREALPRGINADAVELVGAPNDDAWGERRSVMSVAGKEVLDEVAYAIG
jgi:hypothetical protein